MSINKESGCPEYQALSRRQFLANTGKVAAVAGLASSWVPKVVFAQDDFGPSRDVLISVYLRGGSDGLTMCVPYGDPDYYNARPSLAVPPPGSGGEEAIDLDGFFGIPQPMAPILDAYNNNNLLFVHASGSHDPSRSHFAAQRFMEIGKANDPSIGTGWLGRHIETVPPMQQDAVLRGLGFNYGLAKTLQGAPNTLPIPFLSNFGLTGNPNTEGERRQYLDTVYSAQYDPVKASADDTQNTIDMLENIDFENYQPAGGAAYQENFYGLSFKSLAALMKADVGIEAAHLDIGGWDTHNDQGVFEGRMATLMDYLAKNMQAFHTDTFATNHVRWTMVVISEFGRVVAQNGSNGTDHGHGGCLLLLGNKIDGGRVLTHWPGLAVENRWQNRDLAITIDYRDILAEVVDRRLNNAANLGYIFPDHTPEYEGVTIP